jgi:hypothetical protein
VGPELGTRFAPYNKREGTKTRTTEEIITMRKRFATLVLVGVGFLTSGAGRAEAQLFPGIPYPGYYGPGWVNPGYAYNYGNYLSPYGYQQYYNYITYPDVFGNYSYQYGYNYARPYAVGPLHSVYWSPYQNRYIYLP